MSKNKKGPPSINITGENVVGSINAGGHATVDVIQSLVQKTNDTNFEKLFELLEVGFNLSSTLIHTVVLLPDAPTGSPQIQPNRQSWARVSRFRFDARRTVS